MMQFHRQQRDWISDMDEPKYHLQPLPKDDRDEQFRLGAIVTLPKLSELPENFQHPILGIKNQFDSDFCPAFSTCGASELQEGVPLVPEYQFALIKEIMGGNPDSFGADLRSAMKSHVDVGAIEENDRPQGFTLLEKGDAFLRRIENWSSDLKTKALVHAKKVYSKVDGPYDHYDNIRATIWKFRDEKRVPVFGVLWGWDLNTALVDVADGGAGHALYACGWRVVNGNDYLVVPNSAGDKAGDHGFFYLSRSVINKFVDIFGCFVFVDLTREEFAERARLMKMSLAWRILEKAWLIVRNILKQMSIPPKMPQVETPSKDTQNEEKPPISENRAQKPPIESPAEESKTSKYAWDTPEKARHSFRVICDEEGLKTDEKNLLTAVLECESGFNIKAQNKNADGTFDLGTLGVIQANTYWYIDKMKLLTRDEALHDPEKCCRIFIKRYRQGFLKDWTCFKTGAYKRYL